MATLQLNNIGKTFPGRRGTPATVAVNDLTLHAAAGEIVGLLGSSGCGKTTTLRAIAGFVQLSGGEILLDDVAIHNLPPARRGVAMAFEGYALYPPLSVHDNIGFSLLREKKPAAAIGDAVRAIAELLEIEEVLQRRPIAISAGQQQRTSLARALIRRAKLTLLDEPMSQLEPQLRARVRSRVKEYLTRNKLTSVFVTHDQNEAIALADRIAVMEAGVLQQYAAVDELKNRPANLFVAGFIGEPPMNLMRAEVTHSQAGARIKLLHNDAAVGELHLRDAASHITERHAHLGIRPHQVALADDAPLRGKVVSNQWLGDQSHVSVDIGGMRIVAVAPRRLSGLAPGQNIGVDFPADAVLFFSAKSGAVLTPF